MCREWRRCPSNRGERKRAYQRARYAAKKVELAHAATASPAATTGEGSTSAEPATGSRSTGSATAIAASYHAPETTSAVAGYAAVTATPPEEVAARLDDPADPLYIDPSDTSQAAATARRGVVTLLSSSDLSDTAQMDARIAAACDPEMREVVARAGQERAKALHGSIGDFTSVGGSAAALDEMVTIQGRALSVSTGLRTSVALEEKIDEAYAKAPYEPRNAYAADVPEYRTLALAAYSSAAPQDTAAVDAAVEKVLRDAMEPDSRGYTPRAAYQDLSESERETVARSVMDAVREVGDAHNELLVKDSGNWKIEDIFEANKKLDAYREKSGNPEAFDLALDDVKASVIAVRPNDRRYDPRGFLYDRDENGDTSYHHYKKRCEEAGIEPQPWSKAHEAAICVTSLNTAACVYSDVPASPVIKDAEKEFEGFRYQMISSKMYSYGWESDTLTPWAKAVRSSLGEVSPRYEPDSKDELYSMMYRNSQAKKSDSDGIGVAASMYSKDTIDEVVSSMRAVNRDIYVEKSKKRAHYQSYTEKLVAEKSEKQYAVLSPHSVRRNDAGEMAVDSVSFVYGKSKETMSSSTAAWSEGFTSKEKAQQLADEYNALDISKRQRLVGKRKKDGFRFEVQEVTRNKEDEPRYIVRTTSVTSTSGSKRYAPLSVIRVNGEAGTTHHEVAHWVDDYSVVNNDMAQHLLRERTRDLESRDYHGDAREQVIKDGFYNEYVGKTSYGSRASEINSMGVEVMLHSPMQAREIDSLPTDESGKPIVSTAPNLIDPDHHAHTLGVLAGSAKASTYKEIFSTIPRATHDEKQKALAHNKRVREFAAAHPELEDKLALRGFPLEYRDDGSVGIMRGKSGKAHIMDISLSKMKFQDKFMNVNSIELMDKWLATDGDDVDES